MAKVKRHVELEEIHLNKLHKTFPGTSLSYILNELLFHFDHVVMEEQPDISLFYKKAAQRTAQELYEKETKQVTE